MNRPRAKLGLDLSASMAITFVTVTFFLVGFRMIAIVGFPMMAVSAWLIVRKHPKMFQLWASASTRRATMTRANTELHKFVPWFAKAGAACSIVPIARFVGASIFALKGGGYGCLFPLKGIDEEGLTDQELDARMRSIEGALRGLPEGSCLYQYTRVMSGFDMTREGHYTNSTTEVFASDRLAFLNRTAGFRRIDLHWCLTLEPSKSKAFERRPQENNTDTSRMLADLQKTATILESHLGSMLGLQLLGKAEAFQFLSYPFNLEEWAGRDQLCSETGVDRHSDYLPVGKRHVQMFSLKTTPEASLPPRVLTLFPPRKPLAESSFPAVKGEARASKRTAAL
jgi:hypothetical protein